MHGLSRVALILSIVAVTSRAEAASSSKPSDFPEVARNMRLVAHDDLQGRTAYQVVPHQQGGKWYLYIGHLPGATLNPATGKAEENGVSIVDVTDPKHPKYVRHIPAPASEWFHGDPRARRGTQHVQVCDGSVLPKGKAGAVYLLRTVGNIGHEILDVTNPAEPSFVTDVVHVSGTPRTHKNFWDCKSGIAYLVSSKEGWQANQILQAFDLSDPAHPRHIRDFALPGMQPGGTRGTEGGTGIHEATVLGDRIYLAYGTNQNGAIQILDRDKFLHGNPAVADPFAPTDANLLYPQISRLDMPTFWGAHSAKPILGVPIPDYEEDKQGAVRDFLVVTSEGINFECRAVRHMTFFVDITDIEHPFPVSTFQAPAHGYGLNFCHRGVFGPHAPQASFSPLYYHKLLFLAYFAGGVRTVDIRNPFSPVEVGFYIPPATDKTRAPAPDNYENSIGPIVHTDNVEVDERGTYLYAVDRANTGLHVLELTGDAKRIADSK